MGLAIPPPPLAQQLSQPLADYRRAAVCREWVSAVRCQTSTEPLVELLTAALTAGIELHDVRPISDALTRCAGHDAPRLWDRLIVDTTIRSPHFLFYERRRTIETLLAQLHPPLAPDVAADLVRGFFPERPTEAPDKPSTPGP